MWYINCSLPVTNCHHLSIYIHIDIDHLSPWHVGCGTYETRKKIAGRSPQPGSPRRAADEVTAEPGGRYRITCRLQGLEEMWRGNPWRILENDVEWMWLLDFAKENKVCLIFRSCKCVFFVGKSMFGKFLDDEWICWMCRYLLMLIFHTVSMKISLCSRNGKSAGLCLFLPLEANPRNTTTRFAPLRMPNRGMCLAFKLFLDFFFCVSLVAGWSKVDVFGNVIDVDHGFQEIYQDPPSMPFFPSWFPKNFPRSDPLK